MRRGVAGYAERMDSPRIGKKCGSDAEAHDVRERIELLSKLTIGAHGAGDAAVEGIEHDCDADGAGGVIEVTRLAFEGGQYGIVATEKIGHCEHAGEYVNAATQSFATQLPARFLFAA